MELVIYNHADPTRVGLSKKVRKCTRSFVFFSLLDKKLSDQDYTGSKIFVMGESMLTVLRIHPDPNCVARSQITVITRIWIPPLVCTGDRNRSLLTGTGKLNHKINIGYQVF